MKKKKTKYTRICISNDFAFVVNRISSLATSVIVLIYVTEGVWDLTRLRH